MALTCWLLCLTKLYASLVYPVHQTYRQVKDEGQNLKLWSYFWVFYSLFAVLEILSCEYVEYIPLYSWIKAIALVWLYHPSFQGALYLGDQLKPIFQQVVDRSKPITEKLTEFAK